MTRISIRTDGSDGANQYVFSEQIINACRYFSLLATKVDGDERIYLNSSIVFLGGSYIEVLLNECINRLDAMELDEEVIPSRNFWITMQKNTDRFSMTQKWDLITTIRNAQLWDSGIEPFQTYDQILALRNSLVHYKGEYFGNGDTPVKRLKPLLVKFVPESNELLNSLNISHWVHSILSSKELGDWVTKNLNYFQENFKELLVGEEKNDTEKLAAMLGRPLPPF